MKDWITVKNNEKIYVADQLQFSAVNKIHAVDSPVYNCKANGTMIIYVCLQRVLITFNLSYIVVKPNSINRFCLIGFISMAIQLFTYFPDVLKYTSQSKTNSRS